MLKKKDFLPKIDFFHPNLKMLNRYDFASSRFGISGPNTSRNDKNIPCSPHFHLSWQFCRTNIDPWLYNIVLTQVFSQVTKFGVLMLIEHLFKIEMFIFSRQQIMVVTDGICTSLWMMDHITYNLLPFIITRRGPLFLQRQWCAPYFCRDA